MAKAGWTSSSADLTPAQIDRAFRAFAVLRAQIAAVQAGLPVGELRMYDWRVDVDLPPADE